MPLHPAALLIYFIFFPWYLPSFDILYILPVYFGWAGVCVCVCVCVFNLTHSRDCLSFLFVSHLLSTSMVLFTQFMHFHFPPFSLSGYSVKSSTFSFISWFRFLLQFRKIPGIFPPNVFSFVCLCVGCNSICIFNFLDCFLFSECHFFRASYCIS